MDKQFNLVGSIIGFQPYINAEYSLIDKVAWGGSLDYILLKGFFIFDLKDLYISTFEVMILVGLIINYKAFGSVNEKLIYKEFKAYIKVKYLKRNH